MRRERAKRGTIGSLFVLVQGKELRRKHPYVIQDEFCWTGLSVLAWHPTGRNCEMPRGGWVCVCVCGTGDYHFIFPLDSTVLSYRHLYCIELGYCSIPPMNSH